MATGRGGVKHPSLLDDENDRVRIEAPEMFRVLGTRIPEAVKPYRARLLALSENDENNVVRIHAAGAIRAMDRGLAPMPQMNKGAWSDKPEVAEARGSMIKTNRLKIYPNSNEQMKALISEQSIPELKDAFQQMLNGCLDHPDKREWYALWNVELNDGSKTVVGNLSFKGLKESGAVEIGYGTNPGFERQGYMTEAVLAVTRWAAMQDGVKFIEAEALADNIASKRVLEKAGFVLNGEIGEEGLRYIWKH